MTIRKYNLNLDVKDQSFAPQIITRQGDSTGTTQLNVSVTDNGSSVAFNGTPQFRALTSISKLVIVDSNNFSNVEPDKGTFTYDIPSQVLVEPGRLYVAYFAITGNDGVESTLGLTIYVQQAADLNPASYGNYVSSIDGVIKSTQDDITDLQQAIKTAQDEWAAGNFVSITTAQTISGSKTFTAPINGALATRAATFTDFADVAAHMDTYAGNWYVKDTAIANSPVANMLWYAVDVIPGNAGTVGVIRVSQYGKNAYFAIPNNTVLGTWHRVATDTDIGSVNSSIAAVNASVAAITPTMASGSNAGITYLNGWVKDANSPITYRLTTLGAVTMIQVYGWASGPALAQNNGSEILQLPDNVAKYFSSATSYISNIGRAINRAISGNVSVGSSGRLSVQIYGSVTLSAGDGFYVDLLVIAPTM